MSSCAAPNGEAEARAAGVSYRGLDGNNHTALLNDNPASEVIIAAVALGSPQLLMLSGVGPAEELASWNISVVVDRPAVGARMADNPTTSMWWVITNQAVEVTLIEVTLIEVTHIQVVGITAFGSYIEVSSGVSEVRSWPAVVDVRGWDVERVCFCLFLAIFKLFKTIPSMACSFISN